MTNQFFPKISIITPNYNLGDFLERTIESVLSQNYPNLEYIIIDGGSTDNSLPIIKKYESQLSYWESTADRGMYHALNKGFSKSSGEIMGWINSDDMLHPGSLFKIVRYFKSYKEVEWIQGYPNVFDLEDNIIYERNPRYQNDFFLMNGFIIGNEYVQQESTFWKRSLWTKSGGYLSEEYMVAGDFELWMRFFKYSKLHCVKDYLGGFRSRPDQLSMNSNRYQQEAQLIVKKYRDNLSLMKKALLLWKLLCRKLKFGYKFSDNTVVKYLTPIS